MRHQRAVSHFFVTVVHPEQLEVTHNIPSVTAAFEPVDAKLLAALTLHEERDFVQLFINAMLQTTQPQRCWAQLQFSRVQKQLHLPPQQLALLPSSKTSIALLAAAAHTAAAAEAPRD